MAKAFGSAWLAESFVPKIIKTFEEDQMGYNFRMTSIKSLSVVIKYMSKDDINSMVVPIFAKACGDRVPNVQFCVCQQITACKSSIDKGTFDSQLMPKLKDLTRQNSDGDVWYHATMAL